MVFKISVVQYVLYNNQFIDNETTEENTTTMKMTTGKEKSNIVFKTDYSVNNIHLYLCGQQVENTKLIFCSRKLCVICSYLRFLVCKYK